MRFAYPPYMAENKKLGTSAQARSAGRVGRLAVMARLSLKQGFRFQRVARVSVVECASRAIQSRRKVQRIIPTKAQKGYVAGSLFHPP